MTISLFKMVVRFSLSSFSSSCLSRAFSSAKNFFFCRHNYVLLWPKFPLFLLIRYIHVYLLLINTCNWDMVRIRSTRNKRTCIMMWEFIRFISYLSTHVCWYNHTNVDNCRHWITNDAVKQKIRHPIGDYELRLQVAHRTELAIVWRYHQEGAFCDGLLESARGQGKPKRMTLPSGRELRYQHVWEKPRINIGRNEGR